MAFPVVGNPTKLVIRFGIKFVSALPTAGTTQTVLFLNNSTPATVLTVLRTDTGRLQLTYGGSLRTSAPTGITDTNWHLIEFQLDAIAKTLDWKMDGVALLSLTSTGTITNFASVLLGNSPINMPTFTVDYDDLIFGTWTDPATDWYGDGKVLAQRAGSDSTHNSIANNFSPGDAGTLWATAPTDAWTRVDDPPGTGGWTATRSTTDNLAMRAVSAIAFLKIAVAPTSETAIANAVRALLSYSSSATQANLASCDAINPNNLGVALHGTVQGVGADFSDTSNQFKGGIVPVTGGAAIWSPARVNGVTFRFGAPSTGSDISPVPTVQAMMLEVDWPVIVPATLPLTASGAAGTASATVLAPKVLTPYDQVVEADSPVSHWKMGETTVATDRKGVQNLPAIGSPIGVSDSIIANNSDDKSSVVDDTTNQRFGLGNSGVLGIPYDSLVFTMEAWVKPLSLTALAGRVVSRSLARQYITIDTLGRIRTSLDNAGATLSINGPTVSLGTVYHVASTYDGSTFIFYINGVEYVRQVLSGGGVAAPTQPPTIGGADSIGSSINGVIDEVAWYNTALSPARVLAHYVAGTGIPYLTLAVTASASASLALKGPAVVAGTSAASATASFAFYTPTAYDLEIDLDNPISHWKLGETTVATDRKNVRNLPATNGPITTTAGIVNNNASGNASQFASAQSFNASPGTGVGVPWNTATWSAEVWVQSVASTANRKITTRAASMGLVADVDEKPVARAAEAGTGTLRAATASTAMVSGGIYHLVAVADGTDVILYVNGVEAARTACVGNFGSTLEAPVIGDTAAGFSGIVDEVAWYGTALSPARVLAHYEAGKPAPPTPYDLVIDADNPISHYKLGASTTDAIDHKGVKNLTATTPPIATVPGLVANNDNGLANSFAGTAGQEFTADLPPINAYNSALWSMEVWVKPTTLTGVTTRICDRSGRSNGTIVTSSAGDITTRIDTAAGTVSNTTPTGVIANGQTAHIVSVSDGTNLLLYVNGALIATKPAVGIATDFGQIRLAAFGAFNGTIDEVAWYNTALSPARVLAHYQAGTPTPVSIPLAASTAVASGRDLFATPYDLVVDQDTPVSHWKLNEVGVAIDRKGVQNLTGQGSRTLVPGLLSGNFSDQAIQLTRSSGTFTVSGAGLGLPYNTQAWSMEAWVQPTGSLPIGADYNRFVIRGLDYYLYLIAPGYFMLGHANAAGSFRSVGSSNALIHSGGIYHVVGTHDGTTTNLYVNGSLVATQGLFGAGGSNSLPNDAPRIGSNGVGFDGVVDEVAWYNYALAGTRVQAHYVAGGGVLGRLAVNPSSARATGDLWITTGPTEYDLVIDADSPVSHWKMGNQYFAFDRKGVRNLPAVSGPIAQATGIIANNYADQANTFVRASNQRFVTAGTNFGVPYNTTLWSVEAWFKVSLFAANSYIFYRRFGGQLFSVLSNGSATATMVDAGNANKNITLPANTITLNNIYHVVMTYDGVNFIVYLNGIEFNRLAVASNRSETDWPPTIGASDDGTFGFDGTIDEVAWYNTALTPERILAHYVAGGGTTYPSLSLSASSAATGTFALKAPTQVPLASAASAAIGALTVTRPPRISVVPVSLSFDYELP